MLTDDGTRANRSLRDSKGQSCRLNHPAGGHERAPRGQVRVGRSLGQRPNYKKAIVTLKEGDKIELFEGGAA